MSSGARKNTAIPDKWKPAKSRLESIHFGGFSPPRDQN
jgi:hypothetical protein